MSANLASKCNSTPVEGVSKLLFQCGSRDAINRVSTTGFNKLLIFNVLGFNKLLIFNVLYVLTPVETWRAASLQHQCRNFDTPSTTIKHLLPTVYQPNYRGCIKIERRAAELPNYA